MAKTTGSLQDVIAYYHNNGHLTQEEVVLVTKTFNGPASGFSCYLKNDSMDNIAIYLNGDLIYRTSSDNCIYYRYMFGSELRDFEIKIRFGSVWSEANYLNHHYYFSHLYFYQ